MVTRIGGSRRKTRGKLTKPLRNKGKTPIRKMLQTFEPGDKVFLAAEPSVQGGMYDFAKHGAVATVLKKQGDCYVVQIYDHTVAKKFIVHPVHLTRVKK
ncbi:MAG: 50S ribosomal protein L21e [Candidatus Woesearchaeota archaeon]